MWIQLSARFSAYFVWRVRNSAAWGLMKVLTQGPVGKSPLEIAGGRATLGLAQKFFFPWKPLARLWKQPITATSLSMMMVLIKISSSLLQVVVLKLWLLNKFNLLTKMSGGSNAGLAVFCHYSIQDDLELQAVMNRGQAPPRDSDPAHHRTHLSWPQRMPGSGQKWRHRPTSEPWYSL